MLPNILNSTYSYLLNKNILELGIFKLLNLFFNGIKTSMSFEYYFFVNKDAWYMIY